MAFGIEYIEVEPQEKARSCGKRRYATKREACEDANHFGVRNKSRRASGRAMRAYYCNGCQGWHLTSNKLPT